MHRCVVCSNSSAKTRNTRPEVVYHSFPKNEFRRKKWLKVYGIDECFDWHRICSDHFLKENYKSTGKRFLKKDTIPQPYEQNCDENGFPSGYTQSNIQSNDIEGGCLPTEQNILSYTTQTNDGENFNNEFLPREQNHLREVQNAVVNNFESPRRSIRKIKLTMTNEDMSYENMPWFLTERVERPIHPFNANDNVQTVVESVEIPVLSTNQDHTLGTGARCSVKNCFNRYSKNLSFFGYPSDFELRKKWIEICGLDVDPTNKVKHGVRVCRAHFTDDCFMNPARKNRLKPNAVPTLFLNDDILHAKNIPSTSSPVNSGHSRINKRSPANNGFIHTNKPSCSSSNYVANVESNQIPLLVYIDSTTRYAKNFETCCSIPGCITNTINEEEDISLFAPSSENIIEWGSRLGLPLTTDSIVCERHFSPQDILRPNLLLNDLDEKLKSLVPSALPIPINDVQSSSNEMTEANYAHELKTYCSVPGCITNTNEEKEDISHFAPTIENVNEWSSILGLQLTLNSTVCERHFRPQDIHTSKSLYGGIYREVKSLIPSCSMPIRDNPVYPVSNAMSLNTSDVPVLRTYDGKYKRHIPNEPFSSKKIKSDILDKSKATTNKMYFSKNENKEYSMVKNGTHQYNSTSDSDATLKTNTQQTVDLSIVKIEPPDDDDNDDDNDDLQTNLETETATETEQILPIIKMEPIEDDELLPLSSIDDSLSTSLKKLQNISTNSALSITLEPIENYKITKPSVNSFSKSPAKSSMSITLQPKPKSNLSTTINSSPSISLTRSLPSTSSTSMYNISQQSLQQEPTSALPNKLSKVVICPKFNKNKIIYLKPIPSTNKSNSSQLPEIKIPVISKRNSLPQKSDTRGSYSDFYKNPSQWIVIDDDNVEEFIEKDNGFIYEISKSIMLPNAFWKTIHIRAQNSTAFYQRDNQLEIVKKINFYNSLLPKIEIYGKKFEYDKAITAKNELQNLLERIDNMEKCSGVDGFTHDNCKGYYEDRSEDVNSCSACQEKYQEMHKMTESKTKTIESLEQIISKRAAKVLELKEKKINPSSTELLKLQSSSLIKVMRVRR